MILLIASVSMPFIPPFSFEKTYKAFARSTAAPARYRRGATRPHSFTR